MKLSKIIKRFRVDKPDKFRLADFDCADTCGLDHGTDLVSSPQPIGTSIGRLRDNGGTTASLYPLAGSDLVDAIPPDDPSGVAATFTAVEPGTGLVRALAVNQTFGDQEGQTKLNLALAAGIDNLFDAGDPAYLPIHPRTPYLVRGVVGVVGHYGNCFGVPTVGGEIYFEGCYHTNPLVNAMTVGIADKGKIFLSAAAGIFAGTPKGWAKLRFSPTAARWVAHEKWHSKQRGRFEEARVRQRARGSRLRRARHALQPAGAAAARTGPLDGEESLSGPHPAGLPGTVIAAKGAGGNPRACGVALSS
mgnify:CR=1 FL=1